MKLVSQKFAVNSWKIYLAEGQKIDSPSAFQSAAGVSGGARGLPRVPGVLLRES